MHAVLCMQLSTVVVVVVVVVVVNAFPLRFHVINQFLQKNNYLISTRWSSFAYKMSSIYTLLIFAAVTSFSNAASCQDAPYNTYKYCNSSLSIPERVNDLVSRMTIQDKISQLVTGAPAIGHLAIPAYQWWSEGLHGVAGSPGVHFGGDVPVATSFPQVIGLGATFNMTLVRKMAEIISTEARAFYNNGRAGLTYFAPNINVYRDPRWGRGQETPGEDPYLNGQYVTQFVKGMQEGRDTRYLKVVATCKHFCAYDIENANGTSRHGFNAIVSDQDLVETYYPAFKSCVVAGGASIMCSYNAVNGVPSCANDLINNQIVRGEWGFEGYIVSDCGAVSDIMFNHHYTKTVEETMKAGLRGGCDLDCGSFYSKNGQKAYDSKTINDDDLNLAMTRLFTHRMRLGMFDSPSVQPYVTEFPPSVVNTPENQAAALEAARQGIVLLKNDGTLPLDPARKQTIAVIGPNGNATTTMQGNYKGTAPYLISPLMGLQKMASNVTFAQGCDVKCTTTLKFNDAVNAAKNADVVVMVIGLDEGQESEGHDRSSISLPGNQGLLVQKVKQSISNKPLIVVLMSGGSVDISNESSIANAVLWAGYPGQSGGIALAEIIYGLVNPSGRLPITIYPADYINQIAFGDMSMRDSPGRTYKFYTGKPVFEFGTGLSYTTFTMNWMKESLLKSPISLKELKSSKDINYQVKVTNTGEMGGAISVLAYVTSTVPGAPLQELFGFQKVYLDPGMSSTLVFSVGPEVFETIDSKGTRDIKGGKYTIRIGDVIHTLSAIKMTDHAA